MQINKLIQDAREYLNPNDIEVVIYHSPCIDGSGSAFCAWSYLGDNVAYIPMAHGESPDFGELKNKNIAIFDFSFKINIMQELKTIAKKVIVLDHHISAIENLKGLDGCFFDLQHSGAMLAFLYFNFDGNAPPEFIKYIEDRDLWRWQYDNSKAFLAALDKYEKPWSATENFNFKKLAKFLDINLVNEYIQLGRKIIDENNIYIKDVAVAAKVGKYDFEQATLSVAVLKVTEEKLVSEIAEYISNQHNVDFVIIWFFNTENNYKISLRTQDKVNVCSIAKKYGGGGHKSASGILFTDEPHLLNEIEY